jgi:hypothetical protein
MIVEFISLYGYKDTKLTFLYFLVVIQSLFDNIIFEIKIRYWYLKQLWKK